MDNMKIARHLFKIQMDHLKDADMLADYARDIAAAGDPQLAEAIAGKAKTRLAEMKDCSQTIEGVMQRMKLEDPAAAISIDDNNLYSIMYKDYINAWADKVRSKIESM